MAEAENHTLHLLREIRLRGNPWRDRSAGRQGSKINRDQQELRKRVDSICQAMLGESVLGHYATAEFEDRLTALEHRVAVLEGRD